MILLSMIEVSQCGALANTINMTTGHMSIFQVTASKPSPKHRYKGRRIDYESSKESREWLSLDLSVHFYHDSCKPPLCLSVHHRVILLKRLVYICVISADYSPGMEKLCSDRDLAICHEPCEIETKLLLITNRK